MYRIKCIVSVCKLLTANILQF